MHDQERQLDPVCEKERRDIDVYVARLPHRAALVLEAEGSKGLVVRTAGCDAGAEQVGVRDQVRGHERAVAVAGDADTIAIDDAKLHGFVDGRLRVVDQLGEVVVVGFVGSPTIGNAALSMIA